MPERRASSNCMQFLTRMPGNFMKKWDLYWPDNRKVNRKEGIYPYSPFLFEKNAQVMNTLTSWIDIRPDSDFTLHNLPYGIFVKDGSTPRVGVAIGEYVLDLYALAELGYFREFGINKDIFRKAYLNDFISLGRTAWQQVRQRLIQLLDEKNDELKPQADHVLIPVRAVKLQ